MNGSTRQNPAHPPTRFLYPYGIGKLMNKSIYIISIPNLMLSLIPLVIVTIVYFSWFKNVKTILYATSRMLM